MTDVAANPSCPACHKTCGTVPVEIRNGARGELWVESGIRRCADEECWHTSGGTLAEQLTHIQNVYDYKYFGDYELSPEQSDAVWQAKVIAGLVPEMLEALQAARQFIQNGVEFGFIRLPDAGDPALDTLPAIERAIKKALPAPPTQEGKSQ